jgi:transposase, IS5 family
MKAHIGVDVASGVVHTLTGTAANEADINQMAALLHGREEAVFADAGYTGADKRPEHAEREVSPAFVFRLGRLAGWCSTVASCLLVEGALVTSGNAARPGSP